MVPSIRIIESSRMIAGNPDINSDTLSGNELSIDYSVDGDP